jgi:DNA repair and recombination protein RAD52
MPFSDEQMKSLNAPLARSSVKQREQAGRKFSYVEGWHVIAEANRIFGFDRWASETIETKLVVERERLIGKQALPGWGVTYTARVRITVNSGDQLCFRDGVGSGHGIDQDLGQAHESAIKEAETDARKRAMMTFGNPFGLALYDKEQVNVADEPTAYERFIAECIAGIERRAGTDELRAWWNSPSEKLKRGNFGISDPDLLMLKNLVISKLPPKAETTQQTNGTTDER